MFRLFVALAIPEKIRQELKLISCGVPGARWVDHSQLHFTLRFIGEVDGNLFKTIVESLGELTAPRFSLTIKGVGHFPPRGQPKVLWAGIEKSDGLQQLKSKVDFALRRLGVESEKRKFFPHITLARLKDAPEARVGGFLVQNGLLRFPEFEVSEFHLFSSNLHSDGAKYDIEASYPLGDPA